MSILVERTIHEKVVADPHDVGVLLADMCDDDQAKVITSFVNAMRGFPTQWDAIVHELDEEILDELRTRLA